MNTQKEKVCGPKRMYAPTWARDYDRQCEAWPKYLAAIANIGCDPTHGEWLMYREGYAQAKNDLASAVSHDRIAQLELMVNHLFDRAGMDKPFDNH